MDSNPLVSFVIVTYNGRELLDRCLGSISKQTYRHFDVIVVDNGSMDNPETLPYFTDPAFSLISLDKNSGFSHANNIGFERAGGEFVVLLNNDVRLSPDWIEQILQAFDKNPLAGSVACLLLQEHDHKKTDSAGFSLTTCGSVYSWYGIPPEEVNHDKEKLFGPVAAAAAYRRNALEKTGLFHSRFFAYYEDTDLACRLILYGFKCVFAREAVGYHVGSATGHRNSDLQAFHLRRNIEYLFFLNMQGRLLCRFLPVHLLYELLALVGLALRGQLRVFLRAKASVWKNRAWLVSERRSLARRLEVIGRYSQSLDDMNDLLSPTLSTQLKRFRESTAVRRTIPSQKNSNE
jgi:GT2 family glycosyltransferase